jgi:hypothetical protein
MPSIAVDSYRQSLVPHKAHGTELPIEKRDLLWRRVDADFGGAKH